MQVILAKYSKQMTSKMFCEFHLPIDNFEIFFFFFCKVFFELFFSFSVEFIFLDEV